MKLKNCCYCVRKRPHFTFNGKIYMQVDDVAMASPVGPVLADIYYDRVGKSNIT